jgi:AcrR family transcriptional regulator
VGLKERRQREKDDRKRLILQAARTLLYKKGINATSMNQIAKEAELGVATLYSYFKNKAELFIILQEEGIDLLYSLIDKAIKRKRRPAEKLRALAFEYLKFSQEKKHYFDILNYFISSPEIIFEPREKKVLDSMGGKNLILIEEILNEGMTKGVFKNMRVRAASLTLWGTLHGIIQFKKMEDTIFEGETHESLYHFAVESFINAITLI